MRVLLSDNPIDKYHGGTRQYILDQFKNKWVCARSVNLWLYVKIIYLITDTDRDVGLWVFDDFQNIVEIEGDARIGMFYNPLGGPYFGLRKTHGASWKEFEPLLRSPKNINDIINQTINKVFQIKD